MTPHSLNLQAIGSLPHGQVLEDLLRKLHSENEITPCSGRNIAAGYLRGGGLQFIGLGAAIKNDPIYQESIALAGKRTLLSEHSLMNLFLIMKYGMNQLSGDIIEFGAYRGGSALFMANVARRLGWTGTIYALDTFEGLPKEDVRRDYHLEGTFSDTSFEELVTYTDKNGLTNLVPVKGLFEKTTPVILSKIKHLALVHIDCDIYSAVKYALSVVEDKMHPAGGYLIFDDPIHSSCLGALEAVEEMIEARQLRAEQAFPHLVYRWPKLVSQ